MIKERRPLVDKDRAHFAKQKGSAENYGKKETLGKALAQRLDLQMRKGEKPTMTEEEVPKEPKESIHKAG